MQITDYIEGFSVTNIPKCMHLLPTGELVLKGVQLDDVRLTEEVEKYGLFISFLSEEDQSRYIELYFSGFSHMDYNSAWRDSTSGDVDVTITQWKDGYGVSIEAEENPCCYLSFLCRRILDRDLFDLWVQMEKEKDFPF